MTCPSCGFENPGGFRFCGKCGSALPEEPGEGRVGRPLVVREPAAERRQVTVLFSDLVGSTALAERLDPEELAEILQAYQRTVGEVVERYGGHVAQYLGDGIVSYFGYPRAHEDDARRAVHAGLESAEAVRELGPTLDPGLSLAVRVGVHTGPVVAGEIGGEQRRERLALGLTPNVAARLQALASPGEVVVTGSTLDLVRDFFEEEPLGLQALKGVAEPVPVHRIVAAIDRRKAWETASSRGLRLVGRSVEIDELTAAFHDAATSEGRVVQVTGEAGIGKSRLIFRFREVLAPEDHAWLVGRCSAYDRSSAWAPIADLLRDVFPQHWEEEPADRAAAMARDLRRMGLRSGDTLPPYAALLGVASEDPSTLADMSPQRQRELVMESVIDLLLGMAERKPVVVVVEDLHWADPTSLELLERLAERVSTARLLLVLTFRPVFESPWKEDEDASRIDLERVSETDARAIITDASGGLTLPEEVAARIVRQADGVPLYVEELTKQMLESELLEETADGLELVGPLDELSIPTTLQDSLSARLDRLGPTRWVAQVASVLGREFSRDLLLRVSERDAEELDRALEDLLTSGLLEGTWEGGQVQFLFKHALVREAAYESLLKANRRDLHRRAAGALASDPDVASTRPDLLAIHYAESAQYEPAIRAWLRAAELSVSRWANAEAIDHLTRALGALEKLAPGEDRDHLELLLQASLGNALMTARGYAAPEVRKTYARAVELCERMGDSLQLFWMLWALGGYYMVIGDLTLPIRKQMLRMAQTLNDPSIAVEGHFANGIIEFYLGGVEIACRDLGRAVALDTPGRSEPRNLTTGVDGGVTATSFGAMAHWLAGHTAQANELAIECEALADRLGHVFSQAFALTHLAFLGQMERDLSAAAERATAGLAIAEEKGFSTFLPMCGFVLGWAQTFGDATPEAGLHVMRQCLDGWRGAGARIWQTYYLGHLADRHLALGKLDEAGALLEEALGAAEETQERFWEAELHRVMGDLRSARGEQAEAECDYQKAVELARSGAAKSLELRAAVSLARHLDRTGRAAEARRLLDASLAGTEGEAPGSDLLSARQLLQSIG